MKRSRVSTQYYSEKFRLFELPGFSVALQSETERASFISQTNFEIRLCESSAEEN